MGQKRRITPLIVQDMVRVLTSDKKSCIVLHPDMLPKSGVPLVSDGEGNRLRLPRYLYEAVEGEPLGRECIIMNCPRRKDCLNPYHGTRSLRRSVGPRSRCVNGHLIQKSRKTPNAHYVCAKCYEQSKIVRRKGEYGNGWCKRGHELAGDNVRMYLDKKTGRHKNVCRICAAERVRQYRKRKAEANEREARPHQDAVGASGPGD